MKTTVMAAFVAAFLGGLALQGQNLGQAPWLISRSSGVAAFILLSGSVVFGLLMSTKVGDGSLPRPLKYELHQFLSVLTVAVIGLHVGSLLFDGFLHFTVASLVVPFVGPYRTFWVGLGTLAAWASALVTASFWARKRIGYGAWRRLHYLSFGAYVLALVHGMSAGTDTNNVVVYWTYVVSAAAVSALLVYRILYRKPAVAKKRQPAMQPAR